MRKNKGEKSAVKIRYGGERCSITCYLAINYVPNQTPITQQPPINFQLHTCGKMLHSHTNNPNRREYSNECSASS